MSSSKNNLILSVHDAENKYDGHTLDDALENMKKMTGYSPKNVYCDQGYKGHGLKGKVEADIYLVGRIPKTAGQLMKKMMKRRSAIEPIIGHLKKDNRMGINYLKGKIGNEINPILAAATYNFRKLLTWLFFCRKNLILFRFLRQDFWQVV